MNKLSYRALLLGNIKSCSPYIRPTVLRYKSHVTDHRGQKHGDEEQVRERAPSTSDGRDHQGEEHGEEHVRERAPSTAEVLQEMLEEKERLRKMLEEKERQGVVSQTSEKVLDSLMEAIGNDPDPEKVK
ncbi:hypothetical protein AKJ16_DCAP08437 [Drosera capensis]